jgi:exopolysaccharide biosynthesis protein
LFFVKDVAIKPTVKQFMLLLIIGQIFLVGAIIKSDSVTYSDVEDFDLTSEDLEMKAPEFSSEDLLLEQLQEDQMPEPDLLEEDEGAAPEVNSLQFRKEESYEVVDFRLNNPVRILRRNQGGKLLRLRLVPAIVALEEAQKKELEKNFARFSFYQTSKYSEMLFEAGGRIGKPYIATDSAGLFRLSIPFQSQKKDFMLEPAQLVADGVTYYRDRVPIGKKHADVHVLRIEPFSDEIQVFPVLANEGIAQKEVLSSMAKRYNAIAAINGAYFTSRGDPIGTLIINRQLISSPLYKRSVFGVTDDDALVFGNPDFSGTLRANNLSIKIDAVNQPRHNNMLVVYTPEYSRSTLTPVDGVELVLVRQKIVGIHKHDALIPPDGVVVSASGEKAGALKHLRLGQTVKLDYSIDKPWNLIKHAVCGGPRLVADGKLSINGKEEKFSHSIIDGRHPRTAVAVTFSGDLLFLVVDGRSKRSVGMKLSELGTYLRRLGARHAINLDGGGSTSMIIKGKTVNKPSDGGERRISNGILVTKK